MSGSCVFAAVLVAGEEDITGKTDTLSGAAPLTLQRNQVQGRSSRATTFVLALRVGPHIRLVLIFNSQDTIANTKPLQPH